jgi:hypothetical protein
LDSGDRGGFNGRGNGGKCGETVSGKGGDFGASFFDFVSGVK